MVKKKSINDIRSGAKRRQAEYHKRMEEQGYKRLSVYLPADMIDRIKCIEGRTTNEVAIEAFTVYFDRDSVISNTDSIDDKGVINGDIDNVISSICNEIKDLNYKGNSLSEIADILNEKNVPRISFRKTLPKIDHDSKWGKTEVHRFLKNRCDSTG